MQNNLLHDVQMSSIFPDGKTFVDCTLNSPIETILSAYETERQGSDFDLATFVKKHYTLPEDKGTAYSSDSIKPIDEHLMSLWETLTREPDDALAQGSLLPLPNPYIVPGGRFREIYYWDSYFTMLGLRANGKIEMMENMVDNFAYLIGKIGYIPNGNRAYYIGRSQPPFFALMVNLLNEVSEDNILEKYLHALEQEWTFWNDAKGLDVIKTGAVDHVVKLSDFEFHLRYWDQNDTPRPESYREDVELAQKSSKNPSETYRNLRAAAESGWDFSHRWFADEADFSSIHTTDILPVDLNCLNIYLTEILAKTNGGMRGEEASMKAEIFSEMAEQMKDSLQDFYWNESLGFFTDYDFVKGEKKNVMTLAGVFPLFFGFATPEQAKSVAHIIETQFLKTGGLSTTLVHSGQQWDAPNGWAPLQWIVYKGVQRYGFDDLAEKIRNTWMNTCEKVYQQSGKMTEKYDVWNENAAASGGEYPNQDGFGWTNGVYLAMKAKM
jgi:alpha,alpha-trehalase